MYMTLITNIASAKAGTKSIKSTVPGAIAEFLRLNDTDKLEWYMETHGNERVAVVRKWLDDKDTVEQARHLMKLKKGRH